MEDRPRPLVEHLAELRARILWCVGVFLAVWLAVVALPSFRGSLAVRWLAWAQATLLPPGASVIFLDPLEPFMAVMKVGFYAAVVVTVPVALFHIYRFVAPGLEWVRRPVIWGTLVAAGGLMGMGAVLAWRVLIPMTFALFVDYGRGMGLTAQLALSRFVSIAGGMLLLFSLPYLLPLVMVGLAAVGLLSVERLRAFRRFAYLGIAVGSAVVTPDPSLFSMSVLTVSLWVLYEVGVGLCAVVARKSAPPLPDELRLLSTDGGRVGPVHPGGGMETVPAPSRTVWGPARVDSEGGGRTALSPLSPSEPAYPSILV